MQTNKAYRKQMRQTLKGKWFKFFLVALVYQLVITAMNRVLSNGFDSLLADVNNAALFTSINMFVDHLLIRPLFTALSVGVYSVALTVHGGGNPSFLGLIPGRELYGRAVVLKYIVAVVIGLPVYAMLLLDAISGDSIPLLVLSLIGMVAGLIWFFKKMLDYVMCDYLLVTASELSAKEILREAKRRICGYRWQYICLEISIMIWSLAPVVVIIFAVENVLLSSVLTSICSAVVMPCSLLAAIAFFEDLKGKKA